MLALFFLRREIGSGGQDVFDRRLGRGFGELFGVFDDQTTAAQATPGLRFIALLPQFQVDGLKYESRDRVLVGVRAGMEIKIAHDGGVVIGEFEIG